MLNRHTFLSGMLTPLKYIILDQNLWAKICILKPTYAGVAEVQHYPGVEERHAEGLPVLGVVGSLALGEGDGAHQGRKGPERVCWRREKRTNVRQLLLSMVSESSKREKTTGTWE